MEHQFAKRLVIVILLLLASFVALAFLIAGNREFTILTQKLQERAERDFIGGQIVSMDTNSSSFLLSSDNLVGKKDITVSYDAQTEIFRWSNEGAPKKIIMSAVDITAGQFVTVVSNQSVGNNQTIYAKEILILL